MIHQGHTTHSLSREPQVGDVKTNSLHVRVVAEPEALVQLLDLRVRRSLHGRQLHILLLGSLGFGDDALDLLHGEVHAVLNFDGSLSRLHLFILLLLGRPDNRPVEPATVYGLATERPHPPIPQQLSAAASEACIPLAGLLPCAVARAHPLYIIQSHAMLDVS